MKENNFAQKIADLASTDELASIKEKFCVHKKDCEACGVVINALSRRVTEKAAAEALMLRCNRAIIALANMKINGLKIAEWMMDIAKNNYDALSGEALYAAVNFFAGQDHPQVLATLLSLADHWDYKIGLAVINHLSKRREPEATAGLIEALAHKDMFNREAAAKALSTRHEIAVTQALIKASSVERVDQVQREIISALIGRDDETVIPVILPHIAALHLSFEYWFNPRKIIDVDFLKRKKWGRFKREKAISMVEALRKV